MGEMLAINHVASRRNEYKRNANFNQISPRSWWHNFDDGFDYDDNEFRPTSSSIPSTAATYYNSARANGLGFWVSSAYAARRGVRLGVLRGDASHVVQRHDQHGHRRNRARGNDVPDVLEDPRQPGDGQGAHLEGDGGVPGGPHPRVQPPGLRPCATASTTTRATPWTGTRRAAAASWPWGRGRSGAASPSARTRRPPATSSSPTPSATPSTTSATSPTTRST